MLTKSIAILAGITQKEPSKPYFHCGSSRKMNLRHKGLVKDKVFKVRKNNNNNNKTYLHHNLFKNYTSMTRFFFQFIKVMLLNVVLKSV